MKEIIMSQLYKVKLAQGFNAAGRRRAGLSLIKGQTEVLELTKEQLAELEADVWVEVQKAGAKDKATTTAPVATSQDAGDGEGSEDGEEDGSEDEGSQDGSDEGQDEGSDEEEVEVDLSTKSFKELQELATELELDHTGLKSKADIIKLIEESQAKTEE
jgi:hypothetical protein